jgi:hypothetical protein
MQNRGKFLSKAQIPFLLVFVFWVFAVGSRFWANGLSFGLDFGIFQPDGAHYAYRTLLFLGHESTSAAREVANWYQIHGFKNNNFDSTLLLPTNLSTWGLVAPRVVYSVLSIPFVFLFGIPGMLVVPILSLLGFFLSILALGRRLSNQNFALLIVFALSISPTFLRWMLSNITDSPITFFFALVVLVLSSSDSKPIWGSKILLLVFLTSFTRFCLPVWLSIGLVLFFNRRRWEGLFVLVSSSIAAIPTILFMPSDAVLPGSAPEGLIEKLTGVAKSFFVILFWESAQLAVLDRVLLALIVIGVLVSLLYFKEISSQLYISVLFSVLVIGAINGTVGVNFRYQLPVIGFLAWVLIASLPKAGYRLFR